MGTKKNIIEERGGKKGREIEKERVRERECETEEWRKKIDRK